MVSQRTPLGEALRPLMAVGALANLALAAGFASQQGWAVQLWPWETGRLSYLFIASMLAAVGVAAAWIAVSKEVHSLPAGFLNLAVMLAGIAGHLLVNVPDMRGLGLAVAALALVNVGLMLATLRGLPPLPHDPLPRLVRISYVVFTALLLAVGGALILGIDVMPWPLDENTATVFGWIFFGDAFYFAYSVARPHWPAARAQLWSFLAYDAVLLLPLAAHLWDVGADLRVNLLIYLAVLVYSGLLAVHYLILNPHTRGWPGGSGDERGGARTSGGRAGVGPAA